MLKRSSLYTGEYARIQYLRHLLDDTLRSDESPRVVEVLAHEDDASSRSSQCLVGGGSHDMGIFDRIAEKSCRDKSCRMGHVDHQDGADLVCYLPHSGPVPFP